MITTADLNNDGIGDTPFKPTYVYTYGDLVEKITKCNPDNFPLMTPYNTDNLTVDLPEWVSPLLGPSPTPSLTASPTPTLQPDSTPTPDSNYHNSRLSDNIKLITITITVAVLAVVIVSILLYNKRFKSKYLDSASHTLTSGLET